MMTATMTTAEAHVSRTLANRLTTLVDAARALSAEARSLGLRDTARQLKSEAATLDGARTRLIEDGSEYFDAARAFINAAERSITDRALYIGKCANGRG
ncbi:hypothetical protein [Microbacterium sp. XT11]|uniref:hypothetical protein n=1 Tax=Microbacterium sp. XT11 TaxID=367477 RepID=UPI0008376C90|nr:hypothetical protein [Microbacterium sp. XT11]